MVQHSSRIFMVVLLGVHDPRVFMMENITIEGCSFIASTIHRMMSHHFWNLRSSQVSRGSRNTNNERLVASVYRKTNVWYIHDEMTRILIAGCYVLMFTVVGAEEDGKTS